MKSRRIILLGPIIFFQLYLGFSVALFVFGPWDWYVAKPVLLYAYLIAAQIAVLLGYLFGMRGFNDLAVAGGVSRFGRKWFAISLIISGALALPTAYARTGSVFPDIVAGIAEPGAVYTANLNRISEGGAFIIFEYARISASIFLTALIPLTILYWGSLSRNLKAVAAFLILFYVAIFISAGQNKGLADLVAVSGFFVVAGKVAHRAALKRTLISTAIVLALGLVAFFVYFGTTQICREGGAVAGQPGVFYWNPAVAVAGGEVTDATALSRIPPAHPGLVTAYPHHVVAQIAPDFVRNIYESFARYLGQGYQALSLSFDLQHPLTWGVGNSMFFARNSDRLLGTDFFAAQSLPGILETQTGWSMFGLWHSIYPWIASDIGFSGTLIVMGILGFLLARAWINTISTLDPLWGTLLYLLLVAHFYIPANNQVMQSGETAMAFVILVALIVVRFVYRKYQGDHAQAGQIDINGRICL